MLAGEPIFGHLLRNADHPSCRYKPYVSARVCP